MKITNPTSLKPVELSFTTDGSGNATVTSAEAVIGQVYAVQLVDGDLADGVDITLTAEEGDLSIPILTKADWNTDQIIYPRVLEALNTDGTALTSHCMPLAIGNIKAVIAQGGAAKSGRVKVYISGL
jgi:hypothetical protein